MRRAPSTYRKTSNAKLSIGDKLERFGTSSPVPGTAMRHMGHISAFGPVAVDLSTDRRRCPTQKPGDHPNRVATF